MSHKLVILSVCVLLTCFIALFNDVAPAIAQEKPDRANAAALKVGDTAPPLAIRKWVKGKPVDKLSKETIYVVEFWATWCGPCRTTIPHLTKLQKEYADKNVVFMGVSPEEDDALVEKFVKEMGDKMDYRVALDRNEKMMSSWFNAAGQRGIPCAFLIDRKSKIAWIGHPGRLEGELEKLVREK